MYELPKVYFFPCTILPFSESLYNGIPYGGAKQVENYPKPQIIVSECDRWQFRSNVWEQLIYERSYDVCYDYHEEKEKGN
ncbi:hypothetical protein POVWA2_060530 [Plasmodium ovale wallikeri]|uniref:Uncharacterized protein n=1 Tax=Plasmodium ovale wallikeri TaxID=864142 RepID=A0A1A9A3A0_PLAOA|nr:hypothetical protein POVWA2_060530 [Plasmodium ovale wallikeri]